MTRPITPASASRAQTPARLGVWRWTTVGALLATIPAFYGELLGPGLPSWAPGLYALTAFVMAVALWQAKRLPSHQKPAWGLRALDLTLVACLALAAVLPPSSTSQLALAFRLTVALLTLAALVWRLRHLVTRGGAVYLMVAALGVLLLCGVGFWWLEPRTPTLAEGLWLAFTTAATVGYGDVVPSTTASRIFSVFVVLLGLGVLTLATAAIATTWIETEERRIEREILHDLHRRLGLLHDEITALRMDQRVAARSATPARLAPARHTPEQPPDPG